MRQELAAYGGKKVREQPLDPQAHVQTRYGEEEKQALCRVLDSGHLCRVFGNRTQAFKRQAAEYFGVTWMWGRQAIEDR
ncbi:MAG: hypothetical protein ABIG44_17790 [Planctomycetota bacterium]